MAARGRERAVEVRVLGPLEVFVAGRGVRLTASRLRALLAALALSAGSVVSIDRLAAAIWDENLPDNVARSLQTYVSRLRRVLGSSAIRMTASGYSLHIDADRVDALEFARLLATAARTADRSAERVMLGQALALWRGQPFEDLRSDWLVRCEAPTLVEQYLVAVERRIDLDLADGRHDDLVADLLTLTRQHPLRESLWVRLITVLGVSGRRAEALERFETIRARLAEDLGVDPGPELRQAHAELVTEGPAPATVRIGEPARSPTVPHQLPAPPAVLVGRNRELDWLARIRRTAGAEVVAIDGMAGVGKTAFALYAAHQLVEHYPDGQLFMDLAGHSAGARPMEAVDALERILRALGVPAEQIPQHVDDRAALYRSRLAHQHMLILLDNAATETQVGPLLPGAAGCLVLITGRRRLTGLDHTMSLGMLHRTDAISLFVRAAGADRLQNESAEHLGETVELCGRLPLAVRIAAARLKAHPSWTVTHLLGRLRDRHEHRLVELAAGERSVTAALDLSYQELQPDQARVYRMLGLHPGWDLDRYAAATVADISATEAQRLLDRLLDAHLLQEPTPDRYLFHDLVRAHAAHATATVDDEADRRAALTRLFDYYIDVATLAVRLAYPYHDRHVTPGRRPGSPAPALHDAAQATAWLEAELPNLVAGARHAAARGWPEHALRLSRTLHRHLVTCGRYSEAEAMHDQALTASLEIGTPADEVDALNRLGHVRRLQRRHDAASADYQRALAIAQASGISASRQDALIGLGDIHRLQGQPQLAADRYRQALALVRSGDDRSGQMSAWYGLGWVHLVQGSLEPAVTDFTQALALARSTGNRQGEFETLLGLGQVRRMRGHHQAAADDLEQALTVARAIGHHAGELAALAFLGHLHRRLEGGERAAVTFTRLLEIARERGDRNWQFEALAGLGRVEYTAGNPQAALNRHREALRLAEDLAQPVDVARSHDGLAYAHRALSQHEAARGHWHQALEILTALGVDHAEDDETTVKTIRSHLALCPGDEQAAHCCL